MTKKRAKIEKYVDNDEFAVDSFNTEKEETKEKILELKKLKIIKSILEESSKEDLDLKEGLFVNVCVI